MVATGHIHVKFHERESNEPFVRCDSRNVLRKLYPQSPVVSLPAVGSVRRICRFETARQIPLKFGRPLEACRPQTHAKFLPDPFGLSISTIRERLDVERRPYAVRECERLSIRTIPTKLCRQRQLGARSTCSKFQVDQTSHFETAVDTRNPVQARASRLSPVRLR